jgi:hypothetical protein
MARSSSQTSDLVVMNMTSWIESQGWTSTDWLNALRDRYGKARVRSPVRPTPEVFRWVALHGNASDITWMERVVQEVEPAQKSSYVLAIEELKARLARANMPAAAP